MRISTVLNRTALSLAATAGFTLGLVAAGSAETTAQNVSGTITAFDGRYDLHIRQADGTTSDVRLHNGTQIFPEGITLRPGMKVSINGVTAPDSFAATAIRTNYHTKVLTENIGSIEAGFSRLNFAPISVDVPDSDTK